MKVSKQGRISMLLLFDTIFFLTEIIVGNYVNSLVLIVDSFHMLNDILSLIVALYAVKLAKRTTYSSKYSYGWERAEILGALINGVFLISLCLSIFIEAIQRFFYVQEIQKPILVLIVGCAGVFVNIIGLTLFYEHGHGHGHSHGHSHKEETENIETISIKEEENSRTVDEICIHPAKTRQSIILAAKNSSTFLSNKAVDDCDPSSSSITLESTTPNDINEFHRDNNSLKEFTENNESTNDYDNNDNKKNDTKSLNNDNSTSHGHKEHHHKNLNMNGIFLHVLGDFTNNLGVIFVALFIQLTNFSWRYYSDPIISLIIGGIILSSAIPLVRSASFILLQAVPQGVSIDIIRDKIKAFEGIISVHELHIWQLSDTKIIASVHVLLSSTNYMSISSKIRKTLHSYGIHSTTIQPEFVKVAGTTTAADNNDNGDDKISYIVTDPDYSSIIGDNDYLKSDDGQEYECLLPCVEFNQTLCCPSSPKNKSHVSISIKK